jgi:hypothetical protein
MHCRIKAKNICVFTVACQKNLGSVSINFFWFFNYRQNRKCRSRFRNPIPEKNATKFKTLKIVFGVSFFNLCVSRPIIQTTRFVVKYLQKPLTYKAETCSTVHTFRIFFADKYRCSLLEGFFPYQNQYSEKF